MLPPYSSQRRSVLNYKAISPTQNCRNSKICTKHTHTHTHASQDIYINRASYSFGWQLHWSLLCSACCREITEWFSMSLWKLECEGSNKMVATISEKRRGAGEYSEALRENEKGKINKINEKWNKNSPLLWQQQKVGGGRRTVLQWLSALSCDCLHVLYGKHLAPFIHRPPNSGTVWNDKDNMQAKQPVM